jgi:hypothetical protein
LAPVPEFRRRAPGGRSITYVPPGLTKYRRITLMNRILAIALFAVLGFSAFAQDKEGDSPAANTDPNAAEIVTSDIDLFWSAYDKATPENDLIVYRNEYLRKGSVGLQEFLKYRIEDVCRLVGAIDSHPVYYRQLRASSMKIASYKPAIRAALIRLKKLYRHFD